MQEFLNTELKPYNALTREEKHIILDALIDENAEYYSQVEEMWFKDWSDDVYSNNIYRTKPKEYKKLDIPWQVIDEKWNYAAMDASGKVFLYSDVPEYTHSSWEYTESSLEALSSAHILKIDTTGIVAEHSLTERPEGV